MSARLVVVTSAYAALAVLAPALAGAAPWELNPNIQLADDGYDSQKVELVDINNDGFVDVVFANSSGDGTGNAQNAQLNQLFINDGGMAFNEQGGVFETPDNGYVIKAGDLDNDGDADLVVGVNFDGVSYALLNDGDSFTRQDVLGGLTFSVGELELGDVDGDGDLDALVADWGMSQPYGDPDDLGGPVRLWLGDGTGGFTNGDANLPMGMEFLVSWSYDLEFVDIDNDYDLDAMISSRGPGKALVFLNDGGVFTNHPVPALQPNMGKNVNVAFTPMDFNGDEFLDVITLQDGEGTGACVEIDGVQYCAKRNSVLISNKVDQFFDNPGAYWDIAVNPAKLDFDAATLDFNNDGKADFVVTGFRLGGADNNSRLMLNNGTKFTPAPAPSDAALPIVPDLALTFGIAFADFNRDRREDVAVASRDKATPNFVLFGRSDPAEGVAEDTSPPHIGPHEILSAPLYFGDTAAMRGRAHDFKTPVQWHDWLFDENLDSYNLTPGTVTTHHRRLPYMEFALGLADKEDILDLADGDPKKHIAPSVWQGEGLWKVAFEVPFNGKKNDTLTWQFCAIDAAGNKTCLGPFQVELSVDPADCGDGVKEAWESCDEPNNPLCVMCESTCGDGTCEDPPENPQNCPEDCPCGDIVGASDCPVCNDGICSDPLENEQNCPQDCDGGAPDDGECGNGECEPGETPESCLEDCPDDPTDGGSCGNGTCDLGENTMNCYEDCGACGDNICTDPPENAESCPEDCAECPDSGAAGPDGQCQGGDESGCQCSSAPRPPSAALQLLGLAVLLLRRRRPHRSSAR